MSRKKTGSGDGGPSQADRSRWLSGRSRVHGPHTFSPSEYLDWLQTTPDTLLGLDVETTPLENSKKTAEIIPKRGIFYPGFQVRTVQVADHEDAWILDSASAKDELLFELTIKAGKEFVSFTGIDQMAIKRSLGVDIDAITHDCHHLATLVHPGGFENGLKALSVKYLDGGLEAAESALDALAKETAPTGHKTGESLSAWKWGLGIDTPEVVEYAGLDAIYVLHLYDRLKARLGHCHELIKRERWLGTLSVGQTYRGLLVDEQWAQERYEEVAQIHAEASERLRGTWDAPPLSPKRLDWLREHGVDFDDLVKREVVQLTDGGESGNKRPSLDKHSLPRLAGLYGEDEVLGPVLRDMLTVSGYSNLKTNLKGLLCNLDEDGRVHPNIKIMGAVTGRQSVTQPPMQTFKKKDPRLRGCFIADPGKVFVSCDFQNVEVRVAGALSHDERLIEMVSMGGSMHLNNAHLIFGEEITKDDDRYGIAKIGTFACLYGAGADGLAGQLGIGLSEATDFKARLCSTYPNAYVHYPRKMSRLRAVVTDWKRIIPLDKGFEYKASNYAIQSSARELLVDAVKRLVMQHEIPREWIWLLVHDEIIIQCPEDKADEVSLTLQRAMTSVYRDVPITADIEVLGDRWKAIAEWSDPNLISA